MLRLLLCLSYLLVICYGAGCHSTVPSYGPPNTEPVLDGDSIKTLVTTADNGKLYTVTTQNNGNPQSYYLIHVWGTPYEMGYAQGTLLKSKVDTFIKSTWAYFESQIESVIPMLPKWLSKLIADLGLDAALDFTYFASRGYTDKAIYAEMKGLADASGADYNTMVKVHMIAGLTQGACSMFGAWGSALGNGTTKLLQLRALDWDMDGPFRDFSAVVVYHPSEGHGHKHVTVGMTGFVGALTGVSETQLGISEIGVTFPDETFGEMSRVGIPFIFLLRDILRYDNTVDDSINRMANARRTCDLILGVGDGKSSTFKGFEYSYSVLNIFDDKNMMPHNETWHPRMDDVVYWGMDWICPAYNLVLSKQIKKYYGNLTPENAIRYLTAVEQSGDNHLAFYDLTNMDMWVAFAAPHSVGGNKAAYARQFTRFDVNALFNEPPPTKAL